MTKKGIKKTGKEIEIEENDAAETQSVNPIAQKRNALIKELQGKLLTKEQMERGGNNIEARANQESCYQAVVDEINELGKQVGEASVGLGQIRRN